MSRLDLTNPLVRAAERRGSWSATLASLVAWTIALTHSLSVDWDCDAGEGWLTILSDGSPVAYLSAEIPLAIAVPGVGPWPHVLEAVEVQDLTSTSMTCSPGSLEATFGRVPDAAAFDPSDFTAQNLWYATI